MSVRVSILTISDRSSRGERDDLSGPALKAQINDQGWEVVHMSIVHGGSVRFAQVFYSMKRRNLDGER